MAGSEDRATANAHRSDRRGIEQLFREHNAALVRFISARVGSEQDAREIAQEAYVHLLRLDHQGAISYLRAYLFRTAANLAVDRLRQRGRSSLVKFTTDADFAVFDVTPERQVNGEQELKILGAAIAELPPKCRQAFVLHRFQELPIDEIASLMNLGACMVRRYVARALEHVRERLDAHGSGPEGGSA